MGWFFSSNFVPASDSDAVFALVATMMQAGWTVFNSSDGVTYNATGYQMASSAGWDAVHAWAHLIDPGGNAEFVIQRNAIGSGAAASWSVLYSQNAGFGGGTPGITTAPTATDQNSLLSGQWFQPTNAFLASANSQPIVNNGVARYAVFSIDYDGFGNSGHIFLYDPMDPGLSSPFNSWDVDPVVLRAECAGSFDSSQPLAQGLSPHSLPSTEVNMRSIAVYSVSQSGTDPVTGKDVGGRFLWEDQGSPGGHRYPKGYSSIIFWQYTQRANQALLTYQSAKDRMTIGDLSIPWNGLTPVMPAGAPAATGPFGLEVFPKALPSPPAVTPSIAIPAGPTAGEIVREAAQQLGLAGATYSDGTALTDPYSSVDQNIVRLRAMLETLGQRMLAERQWSILRQSYLFNTVAGQGAYPLPPDYDRYIDQTGWNRTNRLPLGGPISAQDRAVLQALLVNVTFTVLFDVIAGQFAAYPDNTVLPGGFLLAYEYQSKWWVSQAPATYNRSTATAYTAQQVVVDGGAYYVALTSGTSGPQASGLTAAPHVAQSDGTVVWMYVPAWEPNTAYVGNDGLGGSPPVGFPFDFNGNIGSSDFIYANGQIYFCTRAGKSATSGSGPSGNGVGIPEGAPGAAGAALWTWFAPFTVAAAGARASPNASAPTSSSDVVYFDEALMVEALKRKFRLENGWPWPDAMEKEYQRALTAAMTKDAVGKMLPMDKRSSGIPLVGSQSVPFTGFGL